MPRRSTIRLNKRIVDALAVERGDAVFWNRELSGFGVPGCSSKLLYAAVDGRALGIGQDAVDGESGLTRHPGARTRWPLLCLTMWAGI